MSNTNNGEFNWPLIIITVTVFVSALYMRAHLPNHPKKPITSTQVTNANPKGK